MTKKFIFIFIFLIALSVYFFSKEIGQAPGLTPDLEGIMANKAYQWDLDLALVKAIAKVESNFDRAAKNPLDPSYGLMQITPALAYDYGLISSWRDPTSEDIRRMYDVNNNLDVSCWFLNHLTNIRPFDVAVQMYNVGQAGYMGGARNFDYLNKVRSYHEKYSA